MLTKKHLDRFFQKLPICNRLRIRPGWVEPEIYFRTVHLAEIGQSRAPVTAYREQAVEISLGPKGAFENGNIGTLSHRVPLGLAVNAVPAGPGDPKPPREPKTPRVVELLRKAIEWQALLESGQVANQADTARLEGITCARVTQVMGLLYLAPEIQKRVLTLPVSVRSTSITERLLRPITGITDYHDRIREFQKLLGQVSRLFVWSDGGTRIPTGLPPSIPSRRNPFFTPKKGVDCTEFAVRAASGEIPLVV